MFQAEIAHHCAHHTALEQTLLSAIMRDDIEHEIAVVERAVGIDHHHPVAVAVEGNAEIGLVFAHRTLQSFGMRRTAVEIDVEPVRFDADGNDFRAQLVEHRRRDVVSRAVAAIQHDAHAAQIQFIRKRAFTELNIASVGIINTPRFAQLI